MENCVHACCMVFSFFWFLLRSCGGSCSQSLCIAPVSFSSLFDKLWVTSGLGECALPSGPFNRPSRGVLGSRVFSPTGVASSPQSVQIVLRPSPPSGESFIVLTVASARFLLPFPCRSKVKVCQSCSFDGGLIRLCRDGKTVIVCVVHRLLCKGGATRSVKKAPALYITRGVGGLWAFGKPQNRRYRPVWIEKKGSKRGQIAAGRGMRRARNAPGGPF